MSKRRIWIKRKDRVRQRYWVGKRIKTIRRKNLGAITILVPGNRPEINLPAPKLKLGKGSSVEEATQIYTTGSKEDEPETRAGFRFVKYKPDKKLELITLPHGRQIIAHEEGKEIVSVGELTPESINRGEITGELAKQQQITGKVLAKVFAKGIMDLARELHVNPVELSQLWIDSQQKGETKEQLRDRIIRLRKGG